MCHSWVKRILRWDKKKMFRFSPLEGEFAQKTISPLLPGYIKEDTIILYDEGRIYLRSDAGMKIMEILGFPYNLIAIGKLSPKGIRDGIYRWVANRRYTYGKRFDSCPMPPVEWRDRFV